MHDSFSRLLSVFRAAAPTQSDRELVDLALRMEASPQTLTNWKKRGVSKDGALKAAEVFGCSPAFILDGVVQPAPTATSWSSEQQTLSAGQVALLLARALETLADADRELIAQQVAHLLRRGPAERIAAAIDALAAVSVVIPLMGEGDRKDSVGHLQPVVRTAYRAEETTKVGGGSAWDSTQPSPLGRVVSPPREEPGSQPIHRIPGQPTTSKRSTK